MKSEWNGEYVTIGNWEQPEGDPRWNRYHKEDEHGNNQKPYYWFQFGPDSFNGQSISCWCEIPPIKVNNE
jgi:hypothetical protein